MSIIPFTNKSDTILPPDPGVPSVNVLDIECPYCYSYEFVKRGIRKKKRETVQLYLCRKCSRTFTPKLLKGKHYATNTILEALSYYHLGFSLEETVKILKAKFAIDVAASSIASWTKEYEKLCAYSRMRPFGLKMYSPYNVLDTATLAHRQLYRFYYHKAKSRLIVDEDFKHHKFAPLIEFLDSIATETPHQYFQEGARASETPIAFSKKDMIVRSKENYATKLTKFVLSGVTENKRRSRDPSTISHCERQRDGGNRGAGVH